MNPVDKKTIVYSELPPNQDAEERERAELFAKPSTATGGEGDRVDHDDHDQSEYSFATEPELRAGPMSAVRGGEDQHDGAVTSTTSQSRLTGLGESTEPSYRAPEMHEATQMVYQPEITFDRDSDPPTNKSFSFTASRTGAQGMGQLPAATATQSSSGGDVAVQHSISVAARRSQSATAAAPPAADEAAPVPAPFIQHQHVQARQDQCARRCCASFVGVLLGFMSTLGLLLGLAVTVAALVMFLSHNYSLLESLGGNAPVLAQLPYDAHLLIFLIATGGAVLLLSLCGCFASICYRFQVFPGLFVVILTLALLFQAVLLIWGFASPDSEFATFYQNLENQTLDWALKCRGASACYSKLVQQLAQAHQPYLLAQVLGGIMVLQAMACALGTCLCCCAPKKRQRRRAGEQYLLLQET